MRSFPSAGRRRWAAASLAVLTVAGLAVPLVTTVSLPWASAADGDNLKKKQAQVQADIADAGHELEESSNELAAAAAALSRANQAYESAQATLSSANAELAAATRTLEAANAKLDVARAALAKAEAELAAARAEDARLKEALVAAEAEYAQAQVDVATGKEAVATQKLKVKATINEIIEQGDPHLLALASLMNATSPEDLVRQQEATATIVSSQSAAYDSLRAAEVVLTVRERQLHAARDAIALQKQQAAQVVRRVAKLERQATASRDEVAGLVTAAEAAQASAESSRATAASAEAAAQSAKAAAEAAKTAAAKAKARDLEILKQLKIEEEKIKQQILAQAKKDRNRTVGSEAGMLLRPVPGEITSRYGYRRHPIYGYWGLHDGNDYRAPCGTPLAASETGKVMSRSYSSVWGNRLFLNLGNINGANYTVIYNHLSAYRASVGQTVGRGETVGYAGTTGWSTGCHLHFTVLKNGDPIDPNTVVGS